MIEKPLLQIKPEDFRKSDLKAIQELEGKRKGSKKVLLEVLQKNKMLSDIVLKILEAASHKTVVVGAEEEIVGTEEAARILGVSVPYVRNLFDDKVIPSFRVGLRHRRAKLGDILSYAAARESRREGLRELSRLSEEVDLDVEE